MREEAQGVVRPAPSSAKVDGGVGVIVVGSKNETRDDLLGRRLLCSFEMAAYELVMFDECPKYTARKEHAALPAKLMRVIR